MLFLQSITRVFLKVQSRFTADQKQYFTLLYYIRWPWPCLSSNAWCLVIQYILRVRLYLPSWPCSIPVYFRVNYMYQMWRRQLLYLQVGDWCSDCHYLVMGKVTVTVKAICALASLKSIVSVNYFEKLIESISSNSVHPDSKTLVFLPLSCVASLLLLYNMNFLWIENFFNQVVSRQFTNQVHLFSMWLHHSEVKVRE